MSSTRWSGATPLDAAHYRAAPTLPGVIVLLRGTAMNERDVLWVEAVNNVRARLADLAEASDEAEVVVPPVHFCVATQDSNDRCERLAAEIRRASFRRESCTRTLARSPGALPAKLA